MKILLDECVDQQLRFLFADHQIETAAYARLVGLKNGALLAAAEAAGFEVLITTDQEIPFQQNLKFRQIAILVLCAPTNRLADLKPLIPAVLHELERIQLGSVIRIPEARA
jgi:predicted nuclease of predicted toxin-antitoxin system